MAPDAQLYLVNYHTLGDLSAAVDFLSASGVKIISHSVNFFNESFYDGTGPVSDIVSRVVQQKNILWVNSAGNEAQTHWEGHFVDTDGNKWNEFVPGDETINVTLEAGAGHTYKFYLTWDDWVNANNDYDLYLFDNSMHQVAVSNDYQIGGLSRPREWFPYKPTQSGTYHIKIKRPFNAATTLKFELFVTGLLTFDEHYKVSSSLSDPAVSPNSFSVATMAWDNQDTHEFYSAQGPTTRGLSKPDITGPDNVSTHSYLSQPSPRPFAGTSAATPHVAGAAAEIWSQHPSMTISQVESFLTSNAVHPGDWTAVVYGAGMLNLPPLLSVSWTNQPPSSITSGQSFTVSWSATGSPDHVNIHWDPSDPTTSSCCTGPTGSTANSTTSPNTSPFILVAPARNSDGTLITAPVTSRYSVHVRDSSTGTETYSTIVAVRIYPPGGDTIPPDTTITSGPNGSTNSSSPTFSWTGSDDVTATSGLLYAYRLDPVDSGYSGFGSTTSRSYSNLAVGNYTFSVKARDQAGNEDPTSATRSFSIVGAGQVPSVVSVAASEITATAGYLNAFVNPNGSATNIYFEYGLTSGYGSTTPSSPLGVGTSILAASRNVNGLSCETTYNFRAVAANVYGTVYADNLTFTTGSCGGQPSLPAITTTPASNVGVTSVVMNATVNPHGETTSVVFQYGPTTGYSSSTPTQNVAAGTVSVPVSFNAVNLSCNAFYNYRAVATNAEGKSFGNNQTFVTGTCGGTLTPPNVTTRDAQGVDTTSALLRVTVNPRGKATQYYFQYGLSTAYDLTTAPMSAGVGIEDLTLPTRVNDLTCDTLYNFRGVASNSDGTTYGDNITFATFSCGPDTQLFNGVSLNDSIGRNTYNFYYISVPPNSIQLNVDVPIANGNIYFVVKAGTKPSQGGIYNCGGSEHCAVQDPAPGIWWIALSNTNIAPIDIAYTIVATVTQATGFFFTLPPCRVIDSRVGASGGPNGSSGFALSVTGGPCGIPPTATAVALNLTATRPTADGYISLSNALGLPPSTASVNFSRGQTRTNNSIVRLTHDGAMGISFGMSPTDNVDFIIDVNGYFEESRPLVGTWRGTFGTYNDTVLQIERSGNVFRAQFSAAGNPPNEMKILSISDTQFDALRPTDNNAEVRLSLVYSGVFPCLVGEYLENGGSRAVNLCMR